MYASASRLTLSPARAKETRPAAESGRRNGSSSGRVSRTMRPPRWTLSIEPVIGITSSPNSVTTGADDRVRRREHVRADAEREVAALLRPDAAADAVGRLEHHRVAVAQAVRRREAGDAAADDDDISLLSHGHLLSVMSSARANCSAALRTSGAMASSRAA